MVRKRNKKKAKYITIAFLTAAVVFGALSITYAAETPLHDVDPGTVITFSGREWIVLEQMPNGETYVLLNEPDCERAFGTDNTKLFDPTDPNNVGYYLNNTFYKGLSQKELIAEHSWDRIAVTEAGDNATDYGNVDCKVGLLSHREYERFSINYNGNILPSSYNYRWWTRTTNDGASVIGNYISCIRAEDGTLRSSRVSNILSVRPALYLQAGLVVDSNNNVGEGSISPGPPAGLSAVAESSTSVKLTWSANTENDLTGYKIYRDGALIATVGKVTSYTDTTASPGTTYTYEVAAYNTSNQEGPKSNPATVTTPTGGNLLHDVEPGTVVTFSGREWIVLEQMPNGETYLILKEPDCDRVFDPDRTQLYNPSDSNNVGYYLNNDFYNSLSQRELIASHSWDRISIDGDRNDGIDKGSINCKVGLISYREYEKYGTYYDGSILHPLEDQSYGWWTRTPLQDGTAVYEVYLDGQLWPKYAIDSPCHVRPTIYLQAGLVVDDNNNVGEEGTLLPATPPGPPAGLSAVAESPTSVKLTWSANTEDDLAGYKIYRDGVVIATVGKVTSYLDTTASPGTTYTYEVAAYNTSNQEGQKSNPATVTTPVPPAALGAMWKGDHIEVVWSAGSTQLGNQAVLWRQMENGPWQAIKTLTAAEKTAFTYVDRNVAMGLNCRYEIRENGGITNFFRWAAIAESGWATGDRPLNAPSGLHISTLNEHSATVTWNAVNGAISYIIEYSTGGGNWQTQTSTGTTVSVPRGCQVKVKADGTYSHYSSISVQ